MENELNILTGVKRISVTNDSGAPGGVISFNPSDALFRESFFMLVGEFQEKITEMQKRSDELDKNTETDKNGILLNAMDRIALVKDICIYLREKIDHLFGAGTSQTAFGDSLNLDTFPQFFEGITPFFQEAQSEAMKKYSNNDSSKVMK
jgi:hypothetical protein